MLFELLCNKIVSLFLVIGIPLIYNYKHNLFNCKPKQYKKIKPHKVYTNRVDIDKDRYSYRKIPKDIDVIVIGSGIGSLSCAAYLSRVGKKVLVSSFKAL